MVARPPTSAHGAKTMGAKILLVGISMSMTGAAFSLTTWVAQAQPPEGFILTRDTGITLGLATVFLSAGITIAIKIVRFMNGNDSRFRRLEGALFGEDDPSGRRQPGVVENVDEILEEIRIMKKNREDED